MHMVTAGWIRPQVKWRMAAHRHSDIHELILVRRGTLEVRIRGQLLAAGPGDMLFYPCGEAHEEQAAGGEPLETYFVGWRPGLVGDEPELPLQGRDHEGRVDFLLRWLRELERGGEWNELGDRLLGLVLHEYRRSGIARPSAAVLRVTALVGAHLQEALPLDRLAREAGLSKFHLLRRFRAETGLTPAAYVRQKRLDAARSLLLSTPLPLKEIAAQTGFADEFHLSKCFHRATGVWPGALRRVVQCTHRNGG